MTAQQFFNNNSESNFNYVGTIYGTESAEMTGAEIAAMLKDFGDNSEMIDHPAYGGENGFYQQSGNVHYTGNLVDEVVFVAL